MQSTPIATQTPKPPAVPAPSITLPKGGGAIRGIGEKFAANPVTGTGAMSVPIAASPGRGGFGPQLSLNYDSGAGNGPFGFGWTLPLPAITRKTDKGLPRYEDAHERDVFLLSGAEDLVPVLTAEGARFEDTTLDPDYIVHRYRPRVEGTFARIERWTRRADGDVHWRSYTPDNVLSVYGLEAEARLADPLAPQRVFSWLLCETRDDKGSALVYTYKPEDGAGVDLTRAHQRNRGSRDDARRTANRYLKRIRYGNRLPLLEADGRRPAFVDETQLADAGWMFDLVFDYGEHDLERPTPAETTPWAQRPDPFSTYRAGFEVRTTRLCQRVLMVHHFPGEPGVGADCLVQSTDFIYSDERDPANPENPVYTYLRAVHHCGYVRQGDGYLKRSLPPLEFDYSRPVIQDRVDEVDPASLANLPAGIDGSRVQWADLHGEGISGALIEHAGGWLYKRNLSPQTDGQVVFGPTESVALKPTPQLGAGAQFMDLAGDGQPDLVVLDGPLAGLFAHDDGEGWEAFRPFAAPLTRDLNDPAIRLVDLDGDGHTDVLIGEGETWVWHAGLAEAGFGPGQRLAQPADEERGPRLIFNAGDHSVHLADLSGDGLTDLVRIRNGEVCYWPNLGYGRFGAKVTMDHAPWFDQPDQSDPQRLRLADLDGSGTTDLIYLHRDGVRVYFNQSGNGWSPARVLRVFPRVDELATITTTDLLGNGTACLVWSSPLPGDARRPMRYVNLMGGQKPHLLISMHNNLGAETRVTYAPSTKFYLQDRLAGQPWATRLPFPVHVVEQVETQDQVSGNRFFSRYTYHHGYFDGHEREFRGFGRVDQIDTEFLAALTSDGQLPDASNLDPAAHVPPILTRSWYHTGALGDQARLSRLFADEYYREPGLSAAEVEAQLLPDTVLPPGLAPEESRLACRALKGSQLRQEVYALDDSDQAPHPYSVSEQTFTIKRLQAGSVLGDAAFFTHPRETLTYHYERNPADPRVQHALTLEVDDFGNVRRALAIGYGRRQADPALAPDDQAKQTQILITYTETDTTNPIDSAVAYRTPVTCESRTNELTGFKPEGATRFDFETWIRDDFATLTSATALAYEQTPAGDGPHKRLIERSRSLFRADDLSRLLPLGQVEPLAIPGEQYTLALTSGLLGLIYQLNGQPLLPDPANVLAGPGPDRGGYVDLDGDGHWWIPVGRIFLSPTPSDAPAAELAHARAHFFLPHRYRDPFGQETTVAYDAPADASAPAYDLAVVTTRDALGNTIAADLDYRVLQPHTVTDANGNRAAAVFDALGMVVATAVLGKAGANEGDTLDGVKTDLSEAEVTAFFADPLATGAALLGGATTRLVYDLFAFQRSGSQPAVVGTLARETHVADLGPGAVARLQHSLAYSDGFGREIQLKAQAEPGPVPQRDAEGRVVVGPEGAPVLGAEVHTPRWVASGWTVFNNKGKPVRQYEPFFSDRHHFEFDVRVGVSPVLFYDPAGRQVASLHPDHTWQKVVFGPWRQETWDVHDTVLIADPKTDPEVGGFFARLPEALYLPGWHAQRAGGALGPEAQDAARKTAVHAATPTVTHQDSLGRAVFSIAHNRAQFSDGAPVEEFHATRQTFDIEGNVREVSDALGRVIMRYVYDVAGNRLQQHSFEAGARWTLADIGGRPIRAWDERGHLVRHTYDALRRPLQLFVTGADPTAAQRELLTERRVYGEQHPQAAVANLRGQLYLLLDQAGVATTEAFDFKGNLLRGTRRFAREYKRALDWRAIEAVLLVEPNGSVGLDALEAALAPLLESESFSSSTAYDALNRPVTVQLPEGSRLRPGYNEAKLLERVELHIRGAAEATPFVTDVAYDAKGRRERIVYGNGAQTLSAYDPLTQRLRQLRTERGSERVQDLAYTYDPGGNITHIRDDAQQTIFFRNKRVEPSGDYTYDAVYRLIEARGREHLGQAGGAPLAHTASDGGRIGLLHPGDGDAMGVYLERYLYDAVGNFLELQHRGSDPAHPGWTRRYEHTEPSLLDPNQRSNRLTRTTLGAVTDAYAYDAHGNLTGLPHLTQMIWDHRDQLQATARQAVNAGQPETTYYVYDASGQRVRKISERQAAPGQAPSRKAERLYLNGFELYREYATDGQTVTLARESVHVMDDRQRIALVETRTQGSDPAPEQLIRYPFSNHLGSASLELDAQAQIISYEEYSPYGSSTYQAVRSQTETPKRYRFTGKERDEESGLYYHGARYYAPWLGRWTACDPIGLEAGVNVYSYCRGRPITHVDPTGTEDESSSTTGKPLSAKVPAAAPVVPPKTAAERNKHVVAFGRAGPGKGYMAIAEANTGLTAINIQDRINLRKGLGMHFPSSWAMEQAFAAHDRPGGIYPMFSGVMVQEALEGQAAGTLHFDLRGVDLTPPLSYGDKVGFAPGDYHSSSEARQGIAHIASTDPGQRKVDIVLQHEQGITKISRDSNVASGEPLPSKWASQVPNIQSGPTPPAAAAAGSEASAAVATEVKASATLGQKALYHANELGTSALKLGALALTLYGAQKLAVRNASEHNNSLAVYAGTFLYTAAAGVVDDALAAATAHVGSAPVLDSWQRHGAGPTQIMAADALASYYRWAAKKGW